MKILIVEDDPTSSMILHKLMCEYGSVTTADNGKAGFDAFAAAFKARDPFQLVLLDIMLPISDGQEVLKQMRAIEREAGIFAGKGTKIIMTTALADKGNVIHAFRENCDAYLVKPVVRSKLVEQLKALDLI